MFNFRRSPVDSHEYLTSHHQDGGEASGREAPDVQVLGFSGPAELASGLEQVCAGLVHANLVPGKGKERKTHHEPHRRPLPREEWGAKNIDLAEMKYSSPAAATERRLDTTRVRFCSDMLPRLAASTNTESGSCRAACCSRVFVRKKMAPTQFANCLRY